MPRTASKKPAPAEVRRIVSRFDSTLLRRIDAAARRAGQSRNAWLIDSAKAALAARKAAAPE